MPGPPWFRRVGEIQGTVYRSTDQRDALGIGTEVVRTDQDQNAFNEPPDPRDKGQKPKRQNSDQQLGYCFTGVAKIEIVHPKYTEEDAQQSGENLVFPDHSGVPGSVSVALGGLVVTGSLLVVPLGGLVVTGGRRERRGCGRWVR